MESETAMAELRGRYHSRGVADRNISLRKSADACPVVGIESNARGRSCQRDVQGKDIEV